MNKPHDIIIRPIMTEKSTSEFDAGKIAFRVRKGATKGQIKTAIKALFGVNVVSVNTSNMPSKPKRWGAIKGQRNAYKKAVVTLAEGEELDIFALSDEDADEFETEE